MGLKKNIIIFGIPTYDEASTIGFVTKAIDQGLRKFFPKFYGIIINSDNNSSDNTKEEFLSTKTKSKKIYLTSKGKAKNLRGKGLHMKMVLEFALKEKAVAVGFIDGDVRSVEPEWIKKLIYPIVEKNYDHILPIYLRHEFDGSITNHLAYPIVYGVLKRNIRQPLAGEVSFSKKALELYMNSEWNKFSYWYGVDIFFVTESIFNNLKIAQVFLGKKEHSSSDPKLKNMFLQVAGSLFSQLKKYFDLIYNLKESKVEILEKYKPGYLPPEADFNFDLIKQIKENEISLYKQRIQNIMIAIKNGYFAQQKDFSNIFLDAELWTKILYYYIIDKRCNLNFEDLKTLRALFFTRFVSFYEKFRLKTYEDVEKEIRIQAELLKNKIS